jgi:hypothetical protein
VGHHGMGCGAGRRGMNAPATEPRRLNPAAAVSRGREDEALAREFAAALSRLPHLVWVPLDRTLARQATEVAARFSLRGSDGIQTAVALRVGAALIALDRAQRRRGAGRKGVKPRAEPVGRWRGGAEATATLIYRDDSVGMIMHTCAKPVRRSGVRIARLAPARALPCGFDQTGQSPLAPSALLCYNVPVP